MFLSGVGSGLFVAQELKKICKTGDEYVAAAYDFLYERLKFEQSQVRICRGMPCAAWFRVAAARTERIIAHRSRLCAPFPLRIETR